AAKTASTSMARTRPAPSAPSGFRRTKRPTARSGGEADQAAGAAARLPTASLVTDAGIEERIQGVHGQVEEDDHRHHHQVHALDDRVVPLVDGVEEEAADPGQAEDRLDHHGSAEDGGDLDSQH